MPKSTSVCNSILALIYNATAWANVADNAAASPLTNIAMALATASYSGSSTLATNEATGYTNYARKEDIPRSTLGWTAPSGGGTTSIALRSLADDKDRAVLTVDENGNRTAVTLDLAP